MERVKIFSEEIRSLGKLEEMMNGWHNDVHPKIGRVIVSVGGEDRKIVVVMVYYRSQQKK